MRPGSGRRRFLRTALTGVLVTAAGRPARAASATTVGLVVPAAGSAADALTRGAALGLDDANALATLFGKRLRLATETAADAAAATAAARALAGAGAIAVVGGAGPGVGQALGEAAAGGPLLALNVAALDEALRNERCQRRLFHLAPSVTMLVDALAQWLAGRRALRWAVLTDGGARGGEIEAAVRRSAGRHGATLGEAADGAEMTFLGLEGAGLDAALTRARAQGRLVAGIGGPAPAALGPDEAVGVWAVGWHHELVRFSARELNSRFRRRFAAPLDEVSWATWAAVKLVGEAVVRAGVANAAGLAAFLETAPPFDGHKGTALTFRPWDRQLRQPVYILEPRRREDVGDGQGPFAVVGATPGAGLDTLGTTAAESRCREGTR